MNKKISVSDLRVGMFVQDLNCDWMDHPFLRRQFALSSEKQIAKIREAGIREVYIDPGVLDLLSVWFQLQFGRKPMLFFGLAGASLFLVGFLAGVVALVLRFGYGIGFRPLLNLVETMVISGIALFGFGFVGELVAGLREDTRDLAQAIARLDRER